MNWFDQVLHYFSEANAMSMMLLFLFVVVIAVFLRLQFDKDSSFDMEDLICHNGRLDEKKLARFGAWVLSSWGFVFLLVQDPENFPEWYFIGYMTVWVGNALADKYFSTRRAGSGYSEIFKDTSQRLPRPQDTQQPSK